MDIPTIYTYSQTKISGFLNFKSTIFNFFFSKKRALVGVGAANPCP
jgi:hypothetical protein